VIHSCISRSSVSLQVSLPPDLPARWSEHSLLPLLESSKSYFESSSDDRKKRKREDWSRHKKNSLKKRRQMTAFETIVSKLKRRKG